MTVVDSSPSQTGHLAELRLRRYRAGEFSAEESAEAERHLGSCAPCRGKLRLLVEEQRAFERDVPFERFAGGVERARRVPRPRPRRFWFAGLGGALAAAAAVLFLVRAPAPGPNRSKGDDVAATVRIATGDASPQRAVPPGSQEMLEPGARVRLGYRTAEPRYLAAVSVDDGGEVTLVYPQAGPALSVGPTVETKYLPDSLEFTGAGREKVFLFLARNPFDGDAAKQAVKRAHQSAKGDLAALPNPTFAGGQQVFSWLFRKP
jgi:anti-sigma factor RsiW